MSLVNACFELPDGQAVPADRCAACCSPQSAMPKSATSHLHTTSRASLSCCLCFLVLDYYVCWSHTTESIVKRADTFFTST